MYLIEPLQQTHLTVSDSRHKEPECRRPLLSNMHQEPSSSVSSVGIFFQETAARPHRVRRTASFDWDGDSEEECKGFHD